MLWAGVVFLFFTASSSKLVPYILPMFPPLAILMGCYLSAAWDKPDPQDVQSRCWILLIANFALGVAALTVAPPYLQKFSDPTRWTPYVSGLIAILVAGALTTLILSKIRGFSWTFSSLTLTTVLFLLVVNSGLSLLDQYRSVKDLANVLKPRLQPEDEVASYQAYYQDLPVYLQRRITVVDWKGELSFGADIEDVSGWMVDNATFWQRWSGPGVMYMITSRTRFDNLRAQSSRKFYLVAQTPYYVLLSNKLRPVNHSRSKILQVQVASQ
jgi:4-amino-4-deoxy-L-arabinose transferase-like glycosyltransferase